MMEELPRTWRSVPLSEVVDLNPGVDKSKFRDEDEMPFVPMPAVEAGTGRIDTSERRSFGKVKSGFTAFASGNVLFAKITPCMENGKMAVVPELPDGVGFGTTEFYVLRPTEAVDPKLLYYFVSSSSLRHEAQHHMTGAVGQKRVPKRYLETKVFPLAPLNEQRRIVEKIETLFARLDKGEEALREVQTLLTRYRQSVLKAAVTGQLTADWRAENAHRLEHGRDLLDRILQARREKWEGRGKYKEPAAPDTSDLPELPEGWIWASLGQLVSRIEAGMNYRCDERPPQGKEVGIVKISAVTWDSFNELESKTVLRPEHINSAYLIEEGDLLISRANTIELVGASVVVDKVSRRLQLSDKVLRLRCVAPLEYWLNFVLKSPLGRMQIEAASTGAQMSMRNISQEKLVRIAVPLPPSVEVEHIVDEIRQARLQADYSLELCETELARSGALRQSILKKAFAGRLVPQDPADEPAADLLARIKQPRATTPDKPRKKATA
jgi:type I restriction enzyme S subunit